MGLPLLWGLCLLVLALQAFGRPLGSHCECTKRGSTGCWAWEDARNRSRRQRASTDCRYPMSTRQKPAEVAPCDCGKTTQHDTLLCRGGGAAPREHVILRPATLLLLAVKFEHVKEAIAAVLICALSLHNHGLLCAKVIKKRFNATCNPYLVRSHIRCRRVTVIATSLRCTTCIVPTIQYGKQSLCVSWRGETQRNLEETCWSLMAMRAACP